MTGNVNLGVNSLITEDSVVLYWDKPENGPAVEYRIYVDGDLAGTTGKTHYSIRNLQADRGYRVELRRWTGAGEDGIARLYLHTQAKRKRLDITRAPYYALGDGRHMNTEAIQRAVDDCGPGETVYVPAGVFLTGALRLHSDMELYLEKGAVLQGTDRVEDYLPRIWSRFEGTEMECYSSLLNLGVLDHNKGYTCRNVVIRGMGTIDGGGKKLAEHVIASERERLKNELAALGDRIRECEKPETIPGRVRPRLINLSNCQNVRISGLTLKNGASWNVHMIYSDGIITDNCRFCSEQIWNGDGWDPDSSTNCTIFGCVFCTGDDAIAVKSGKNPEGNRIGRPSRHIRIFDCRSQCGHGITIGSEMSGGIEDVRIWDCDMSRSRCGIEIKGTKKRGGYVRDVSVRDSCTARVLFHSVGYNDDGDGAEKPPVFERCKFENVRITGEYLEDQDRWKSCAAVELCGFQEPGHELRDLGFRNIRLGKPGSADRQAISLQFCENVVFDRVSTG